MATIFPPEQTLQLLVLRVKVYRKNTNKKYGRPCQVQPIFETLAPRLKAMELPGRRLHGFDVWVERRPAEGDQRARGGVALTLLEARPS